MRRRYLVSYDVADDKRRAKIFELLQGFGDHVQYSVFVADLTGNELVRLRTRVRALMHEGEDQTLIVDMGNESRPLDETVEVLGKPYRPSVRSHVV